MTKDQWGMVKQKLLKNVGQNNFKSWIEPLEYDHTENGVAVIGAPNSWAGTYVSRNFGDLILGEVSVAGFWAVVDSITDATGNVITYM